MVFISLMITSKQKPMKDTYKILNNENNTLLKKNQSKIKEKR
jgi:hypothetical protein